MEVDRKLLEHVAEVARLKLSEDEIMKFLPQLKELLEFFSQLKGIETGDAKPSFQPVELKNILREDKEGKCLSQDEALSLTEHKKDGYFKGPRAV
ncbi:Asp-tRNA(Asn)/Glu-tRNA(Gln) amidotransferase subunit GatC [Candidatus Woesearchaeota archaeon]|nr:Asp-tRNA(Asn)/Glu-tRNA(Gln) amidotransferase subunit GatC [Candidatus Woesearchaeota archaeon]